MILRREEEGPAAVSSYALPLLLVVLICGAYLYWRRSQRENGFGCVRLCTLQIGKRGILIVI